jgi:hypothetical protein
MLQVACRLLRAAWNRLHVARCGAAEHHAAAIEFRRRLPNAIDELMQLNAEQSLQSD